MSTYQRHLKRPLLYITVIVVTFLCIFPIYWMFVTSLAPTNALRAFPPQFIPRDPQWSNYAKVMTEQPMLLWLFNSFVVALAAAIISIVVSVLAAYSLSRYRVWGSQSVGVFVLTSRMLPGTLLVIPLFIMFRQVGLVGNLSSLIIAHVTFIIPFAVWMLKGYFDSIPIDLEESAMIDGCNPLTALWRVILPIATPGIAATALYAFILSWGDYLFARTFLVSAQTKWTIPIGISTMQGEFITGWNEVMAASLIGTLPILIMYLFLERYLVGGLSAGSVK